MFINHISSPTKYLRGSISIPYLIVLHYFCDAFIKHYDYGRKQEIIWIRLPKAQQRKLSVFKPRHAANKDSRSYRQKV